MYFLGIDVGTYESKGCIVNEDFKVVASTSVRHELRVPRPGWAEHDADDVWWSDFVHISKTLLREIDPNDIAAVACSAIAPAVLPVDADGKPLRPAILYGIDTRASSEIEELEGILGKDWIRKKGWNELSSQAAGPKILWIKKNEPHIFKRTWKIMTATTYLVYKLTGNVVIDYYTASAFTPLIDMNNLNWLDELSDLIISPNKLPDLKWSADIAGYVTKEASLITGIPEGTPVTVGTADAAAEFLSTGAGVSDVMIMVGSSVFFIKPIESPAFSKELWNSVFLKPGTYCTAGGMATGGAITKWFRDNFAEKELEEENQRGVNAYELLWKRAEKVPPGSHGLLSLPYFSGERTPINDPKARGVIFGLTLSHDKYSLYRSLLEGVAFGIRHNIEKIKRHGKTTRTIVVGGGIKNKLWLRIISSVIEEKLLIPPVRIGASFGDALMGAISQHAIDWNGITKIYEGRYESVSPDPDLSKVYEKYYKIYEQAWPLICSLVHSLVNIEEVR